MTYDPELVQIAGAFEDGIRGSEIALHDKLVELGYPWMAAYHFGQGRANVCMPYKPPEDSECDVIVIILHEGLVSRGPAKGQRLMISPGWMPATLELEEASCKAWLEEEVARQQKAVKPPPIKKIPLTYEKIVPTAKPRRKRCKKDK